MRYKLEITSPTGGRSRKSCITVLTPKGEVKTTDRADLESMPDRDKLIRRLARKLGVSERGLRAKVEAAWAEAVAARRQREEQKAAAPASILADLYSVAGGTICRTKSTPDGELIIPLCNFDARIVGETVRDDGVERSTWFAIEGTLLDGRPLGRADVPADGFTGMNWVVATWGTRATVYAGMGTRDHLRAALQILSGDVPRTTVYTHTGWREIGGRWVYLHAGGAISENAAAGIQVCLPDALARYSLPDPPKGRQLVEAVRASLRLLELGPPRIMFPVLAAVFRAALGDTDFTVHFSGESDSHKTEVAAMAQQHYGAGMNARNLPASWSSTGNSLEGTAFAAKDAMLVVDDFAPSGSVADVQRYHREADRIIRAQGNRSGRQRMRADGTLRPAKPPRGMLLSTGEDVPKGYSIRARMFGLDFARGDIPTDRLTPHQRDAAAGLYAGAMAGFLEWVAPQYVAVKKLLRTEVERLRTAGHVEGRHRRTSATAAELLAGWDVFLRFALAVKAVRADEAESLRRSATAALADAAERQTEHQADAEPAAHFLRLVAAAITSGRAHLAGPEGQTPDETPASWGWRRREGYGWEPQGRRVGWVEGGQVYLDPEGSYAEAQRLAGEQGESLGVTKVVLHKRLHERGLLVTEDRGGRRRLTVRKQLQGARRAVLYLLAGALTSEEVAQVSPVAPAGHKPEGNGPQTGDTNGACNGFVAPESGPNRGDSAAVGHKGHKLDADRGGQNKPDDTRVAGGADRGDAWEGDE
jgi:hypothetical protein